MFLFCFCCFVLFCFSRGVFSYPVLLNISTENLSDTFSEKRHHAFKTWHWARKNRTRFKCDLKQKSAARYRQEWSAHCPGAREGTRHSTSLQERLKWLQQITDGTWVSCICGSNKGQALRAVLNKTRGCQKYEVTFPFCSTGALCPGSNCALKQGVDRQDQLQRMSEPSEVWRPHACK